ncbi:predicted protein [Chaetoceros tenuissimus]|uniref:Uncharacterized protein n=1 Tax=Chaetoceros tenuissimus TaxID=426638 RepID=A0AAD3HFU7_9STRA|nr:predicted protein [Chaetoceros tenuissimus]
MNDEDDSSIPPLVERGDSSFYSDSAPSDDSNSFGSMPRLVTRAESRAMAAREQRSGRETPESLPDLASDSSVPDLIEYDFHRLIDRSLFRDAPQMHFQNNLMDMLGDIRMRMNVYYMDGMFDDSTYSASSIDSDFTDVDVEPLLDPELEFRKMVIHMMIEHGFGGNIDARILHLQKDCEKPDALKEIIKNWRGREMCLAILEGMLTRNRFLKTEEQKENRENDIMNFVTCFEDAIEEIDGLEGDSDSDDSYNDDEVESGNEDESDIDDLVSSEDSSSASESDDDDNSLSSLPPLMQYIPNENEGQTRIHRDASIVVRKSTVETATELTTLVKTALASKSNNDEQSELRNCHMELIQKEMELVLEKINLLQRKRAYLKDKDDFEKITSLPELDTSLHELNTETGESYCQMISKNVLAWVLAGEVKQRIGLLMDSLLHSKMELNTKDEQQDEQQDESQVFVAQKLVQDLTSFARFLDEDVLENRMIHIDEDGTSYDSTLNPLRTNARNGNLD